MYSIISSKEKLGQIRDAVDDDIAYMKDGTFKDHQIEKVFNELIRFDFSTLILDLDSCPDKTLIESVKKFRILKSKVRIIILAVNRLPGDKIISELVKLGIYDIVAPKIENEQEIMILPYLTEILNKEPALYSQAARWDTKDYIDSKKSKHLREKVVEKEVVKVIEKEIEKKVEIVDTSIITVLSGACTGKTFLTWNLAHCFASRDYKVSVVNLDRGYSANVFFAVPEEEQALKDISKIEIKEDIFDKAYILNDNLRIFTGELCSSEKISVNQFLNLINIVQAQSDITIIDLDGCIDEVVEMSVLHSNLNLFVFDIDNMHYHLNLKFLDQIQNLNFRKTIAVINNAFMESQEVKNVEELINKIGLNRICTVRNDGEATYNAIHTDSCTYFETKNKDFKKDIDNLLNIMKSKEKKKSFLKKILGI